MHKIIITVLLFSLTFCSHNMALAAKFKVKPTLVTSIGVTNPEHNAVWMQNKSYIITWDTVGKKFNTVKIVLLKLPGETRIHVIKESTQNTGSCFWKIPGSITPDRYKIQVRVSNTRIYDRSDEFTITRNLKSKPVDLSSRQVIVTNPKKNRKYAPGAAIPVNWETEIPKEILKTANVLLFDIDLYNKDGAKKIFTIKKDLYYFDCQLSGKRYSTKWFWKPDQGNKVIKTGQYKIKITPKFADNAPAGMPGFSGMFNLSRGVETVTKTIKPKIKNRHSLKMKYYTDRDANMSKPPVPEMAQNRPKSARVGFHNWYHPKAWGAYLYHGFVFRSQLIFPVDTLKESGKILLKAELHLKVDNYKSTYYPERKKTCARALYYMTGPWSGKCTDTPGYLIKNIPDQSTITLDITQWAQNWYTGSEPNHGLLLLAWDEEFKHTNHSCITWYKGELILEFVQGN